MARVKDILKHVSAEVAGRRRKCSHKNTHVITKGQPCIVVSDGAQSRTTYCTVCAEEILAKASLSLQSLRAHVTVTAD
jgi:hypothetical protein